MSINRYPRYVNASDELKGALVTYVHEVKMTAPELAPQAEKLMRTVLEQDVEIFNHLRSRRGGQELRKDDD
ncbi:hypothetical protein [Brevibacillus borstelensis]|uniref:hypothetical protein n=1 Tax=Brevibacillus borstelensis TaxID=45462 RepID=UPI0004F3B4BB|nr:hypothetical protein [Brevibacillus borstelensis]KKX54445.1 hypothetical protein X546_15590 [Brevibacillus borstelensis cifa_chp40]